MVKSKGEKTIAVRGRRASCGYETYQHDICLQDFDRQAKGKTNEIRKGMTDILLAMLERYGMKEVDGSESNPEIIEMGKELGFDIADDSTTAWCSLALNYFAKKCGYEYSKSLAARSWLKMPIMILKPSMGDVVVFWRNDPTSWEGHVGLFINWNDKYIWVLGGNQSNSLSIMAYPRERLLGFRQLRKLEKI